MTDRRSHAPGSAIWMAASLLLLFALACILFASKQNIWIDESTQLSGITLSPIELARWLAGKDPGRFGVPGDRMPPLGYLLDWAWWHGVSQSVWGLRLFHAMLVLAALWLFASTERRNATAGRLAGIGLIFLVVSPKTIQMAVELRAYPMLFACACVQAALFMRLVAMPDRPTARSLGVFAVACVATCFVHFFGVVATFAYFGALLLRFARIAPLRIVVAGFATLIPITALKPFVVGATSLSDAVMAGTSPVQYVLQLIAGSPYLVVPLAGLLFIVGCAVLLAVGIASAVTRAFNRRTEPIDHIVVVATLGIAATIVSHFFIASFDTLKPSYSIWLLPVLALIIASGARRVAGRSIWLALGVQGAIVALIAGATLSTAIFLTHADWYVHGPAQAIAMARREAPADTPIVYIGADTYPYGYFPTFYLTQGRASQWLADDDGLRRLPDTPQRAAEPLALLARHKQVLIVDTRLRRYVDLGQCLKGACPLFDRALMLDAMLAKGEWREGGAIRSFGYYDTMITRLVSTACSGAGLQVYQANSGERRC